MFRPTDYWVVKIDGNGNKLWDKTLGGTLEDVLQSVITTPDGGYLLGGTSYSEISGDKSEANRGGNSDDFFDKEDFWVVKINSSGVKVWDKTFGGNKADALSSLVTSADGGYLLGGSSLSGKGGDKSVANKGLSDYWIIKIDGSGSKVWDKTYGGSNGDAFQTMITTTDGGYLLGGSSTSNISGEKSGMNRGDFDYWIVKIGETGDKLWDKTYGGSEYDQLFSITTTSDGYLLGGYSWSGISGDKIVDNQRINVIGPVDFWVIKVKEEITPPPISTWNQTYGGKSFERLTSVVKTGDGGYLLGGHSLSRHGGDKRQDTQGRYDFWLVKTDATGAKLWDKRYGGNDDDFLNQIIPTADGGYLLAGSSKSGVSGDKTTTSRGSQDFWIVKVDVSGNKLWDQTYGGSGFEDLIQVVQLSTGEYVLAGVSDSDISGEKSQHRRGSRDFWLVKVSTTGVKLWDKRYGGSKAEELTSLLMTSDGGFVLGGSSLSGKSGDKSSAGKGGKDYWIVRTDDQGNQLWDKSYGGNGEDQLTTLATTTDGALLLAGHSSSGMSGNKSSATRGSSDYWVVKTDATGAKLWDKTYGGNGEEELSSLISTHDNGWLLGGSSFSNQSGEKSQNSKGSSDYWVVKTNEEGEQAWDQTYGGAGEERLRYLLQTEDQGYLLAGFSFSGQSGDKSQERQGRSDYWLVKISPTPVVETSHARIAAQPEVQVATPVEARNFRAYPIPAKEKVTVQFSLPQSQPAVVQLYNAQGAKVKTLFQGEAQANKTYKVEWQPASQDGNGLYFLQLRGTRHIQQLKLLLSR